MDGTVLTINRRIKDSFSLILIHRYRYIMLVSLILIIFSLINFYIFKNPIFYLNENQILYIFSVLSQVISGMFALTITAFVFYNDKLTKELEVDESLIDIINRLKSNHYKQIVVIGINCFLAIALSMFMIVLRNSDHQTLFNYLLNSTIFLCFFCILLIILFCFNMINPRKFSKVNDDLGKESLILNNEDKGNLHQFLTLFNSIERNLMKIVKKEDLLNIDDNYRLNMMSIINILYKYEKINKNILNEIDLLRKNRNIIVHSHEPYVSEDLVDLANKINSIIIEEYLKDEGQND